MKSLFLAAAMAAAAPALAQTPAIPEPGLFLYGPVVSKVGQLPVAVSAVQWQVAGNAEGVTVDASIVNVNGSVFYVARIPFETRVVGTQNFSRNPGTLELKAAPAAYTRAATADGLPTAFVSSSLGHGAAFTFGAADRGVSERVVLSVDKSAVGDKDSDGDGVSDAAEAVAGTNPNDPKSFFQVQPDLGVNPQGGLVLKWASVTGRKYTVSRGTDLTKAFSPLASNVVATPPQNTFSDTTPLPGAAMVFYRIQVSQ